MDEYLQVLSGLQHFFVPLAPFDCLDEHAVLGLARLAGIGVLQFVDIEVAKVLFSGRLGVRLNLARQIDNQLVGLLV